MAENFLVIFGQQHSGAGTNLSYKNQTEASGVPSGEICKTVTVNAGTAQEAATAVRKAFGESVMTNKVKVVKSSSVEEKSA